MLTAAVEFDLRQELEDLRQQIRALQPSGRLRLQTQQATPLLGQPVVLTVSVTDPIGQPLIDTPLTLLTTWGNLRTTQELIPQQAGSLATRTDALGQVVVVLLPPTSEDLAAAQQEALETFLTLLNAQAVTPQQTQDSLTQLVNLYNWEANVAYRQAVDIYFRDFGQGLLESVNAYDYLQSWSYQNATVIALLQPDGEGTQAIASLTLRFKNWLAPWLETYLMATQQEDALGQSLGIIKERGEAGSVVEGVYDRLQSFMDTQQGIVGQYIGRKVAEASINEFLNSGIEDLDVGVKVALAPSLTAAAKTLQAAGVGGLVSVVQTRSELTQVISDSVGQSTQAIATLTDQLGTVTTQVDRFQTNLSDLQTSVGSVNGRLEALQASDRGITASVTQLSDRLSSVQQTSTGFTNQISTLTTRLDGLQRDQSTLAGRFDGLQRDQTSLVGRVDGLQQDQSTIVSRIDRLQQGQTGFNTTLSNLNTRLDGVQQNVTTLDQRTTTLTTQFNTLQTNVTRIDTQTGSLQTSIGRLTEQIGGFQNRFTVIDSQIGGLQNNLGQFVDRVGGFQNRLNTIDNRLSGLQNNVGRLGDQVGGFQNRFSMIDSQLGGLQSRVGTLDTQIGRFQGNFDRFSRIATNRVLQLENSVTRVGNNTLALRTDFDNRLNG